MSRIALGLIVCFAWGISRKYKRPAIQARSNKVSNWRGCAPDLS